MRSFIAWAISRSAGMNIIMLAIMLIGGFCMYIMRRETFPEFELEVVMVTVPYPGASPAEIEKVVQPIEQRVRGLENVKKVTTIARESGGYVLIELYSSVPDVTKVVNQVDREVRNIPNFPDGIEDPEVEQITFRQTAIRLGIIGPDRSPNPNDRDDYDKRLRSIAEAVDEDLLQLKSVSSTTMLGARNYQIDVEISESTLREYGLSLDMVADMIRRRNVELPGGQLRGKGEEVLLRAKNKGRVGEEIAKLPLVTRPGGVVLTIDDLGTVRDDFVDSADQAEINGHPAIVINVERTKSEDLLGLVEEVRAFVDQYELPPGYRFEVWDDTSTEVRGRMELLIRNGSQGLLLVFLVLTLFLEMRLAFWVALGIPISIFGAGMALSFGDQTLNMLSMFSFLLALGIVVDDAIVIGENIYAHIQMGKPLTQAATDGTSEVLPSVITSVTTTVIAFMPMFFVSGVMGKFMAVIPFAVIAMLLISLLESAFVLPCHLAHRHSAFFVILEMLLFPIRPLGYLLGWLSKKTTAGMAWLRDDIYVPMLRFCLANVAVPLSIAAFLMIFTVGMVVARIVPTDFFPSSDNNRLQATITFPNGTPESITDAATRQLELALRQVSQTIAQERAAKEKRPVEDIYPADNPETIGPVRITFRQVGAISQEGGPMGGNSGSGGHTGQILAELYD
ncbi:MAG: efflux RND transporter permease subunit, partial [Planctomycetota bacterium]